MHISYGPLDVLLLNKKLVMFSYCGLALAQKGVQLPQRGRPDHVKYRHLKCFRSQSGQIPILQAVLENAL